MAISPTRGAGAPDKTAERLLRLADVQQILGISRSHAYRLMMDGALGPKLKLGRARRVRASAVYAYIDRLSDRTEVAP